MTDQHVTKIVSYTDYTFRAKCCCGWKSARDSDRERAVAYGFFHREAKK